MNQKQIITSTLKQGGAPVVGATMTAKWYYKTTTSTCIGKTKPTGVATCALSISHATPGYTVRVAITFTDKVGKVLAQTGTSFTPAGQ